MITLTQKINENLYKSNNRFNIHIIAKVLLPGRKRRTGIECYNLNNINENDTKLDYDDQIVFKYYCFYKWGVKYQKYDGLHPNWVPVDSFDYITCVDGQTNDTIENVFCDGSLTFKEARELLEQHFNIK